MELTSFLGNAGGISEWPSRGLGGGGEWYLRHSKRKVSSGPLRGRSGMTRVKLLGLRALSAYIT